MIKTSLQLALEEDRKYKMYVVEGEDYTIYCEDKFRATVKYREGNEIREVRFDVPSSPSPEWIANYVIRKLSLGD